VQASFGCDHFSSRAISLAFLALGGTLADAAHQQLPGVENRVAKLYRRDSTVGGPTSRIKHKYHVPQHSAMQRYTDG